MTARWPGRLLDRRRVRAAVTLSGRGREGVVQAGKMALAAVVALLFDRTQPFIAAYAAVFMMSGTVYRSLLDAARQVTTVVLGVLVAFGAGLVIPWQPAALGVAVFALILPPLTLRDAGRAVAAVSGEIADLLESIATGLRDGWDENDARRWRRAGRQLGTAVRHAEEAVGHGRESMWLNSRRLWSHAAHPVVEQRGLHTLYEITQHLQQLTEVLVTSAEPDNTLPATGAAFDTQLAILLDTLAENVRVYRDPHTRCLDRQALVTALDLARDRRAALARLVPWPDLEPSKDWSTHAAAMLAVERALRTLLDAADPG